MKEEDRACKQLERELSMLPMPDLWEKIQHQIPPHAADTGTRPAPRNYRLRRMILGAASAAAVIFLVFAVLITVRWTSGTTGTDMIVSDTSENISWRDMPIIRVQAHSLSLSERPTKEIESLLGAVSAEDQIYEDSAYLYQFDDHGQLKAMAETASGHSIDIEKTARRLIAEHFPDVIVQNYRITIDESNGYPMLCAKANITDGELNITEICMRFYTENWPSLLGFY